MRLRHFSALKVWRQAGFRLPRASWYTFKLPHFKDTHLSPIAVGRLVSPNDCHQRGPHSPVRSFQIRYVRLRGGVWMCITSWKISKHFSHCIRRKAQHTYVLSVWVCLRRFNSWLFGCCLGGSFWRTFFKEHRWRDQHDGRRGGWKIARK
jgi:hypothetical protein